MVITSATSSPFRKLALSPGQLCLLAHTFSSGPSLGVRASPAFIHSPVPTAASGLTLTSRLTLSPAVALLTPALSHRHRHRLRLRPLSMSMFTESSPTPTRVRIVSYNLLSSHLASPTFHTRCDPAHLEASNRLPKILAKLDHQLKEELNKDPSSNSDTNTNNPSAPVVFCLQEVSHDWASALHTFFAERDYHFVTALYGRHFSGYMGIGTAYPIKHFQTLTVDICRLSDVRPSKWPRPRPEDQDGFLTTHIWNRIYVPSFLSRTAEKAVKYVRDVRGLPHPPKVDVDPWQKSEYRSNQFIAVKLKSRLAVTDGGDQNGSDDGAFWVGNYHMPCAFREPAVMTIHSEMVATRMQKLAQQASSSPKSGSDPFILAGDFNIMPNTSHYKLLTTGKLDEHDVVHPPERYGVKWTSTMRGGLKSAYALYDENGKESDFTNYAHNGDEEEPFIGTLDYIFLSSSDGCSSGSSSGNGENDNDSSSSFSETQWKVKDVLALVDRKDANGPYPNEVEPSDHVLIAATLELQ